MNTHFCLIYTKRFLLLIMVIILFSLHFEKYTHNTIEISDEKIRSVVNCKRWKDEKTKRDRMWPDCLACLLFEYVWMLREYEARVASCELRAWEHESKRAWAQPTNNHTKLYHTRARARARARAETSTTRNIRTKTKIESAWRGRKQNRIVRQAAASKHTRNLLYFGITIHLFPFYFP